MDGQNKISESAPPVIFWFKVYTATLAVIYGLFVVAGPVLIWIGSQTNDQNPEGLIIQGILFIVICLPLTVASALPIFLKPSPWVWVYDLVLIGIGMTSCCFLPATIPLLIYWIKPETKNWFHRV